MVIFTVAGIVVEPRRGHHDCLHCPVGFVRTPTAGTFVQKLDCHDPAMHRRRIGWDIKTNAAGPNFRATWWWPAHQWCDTRREVAPARVASSSGNGQTFPGLFATKFDVLSDPANELVGSNENEVCLALDCAFAVVLHDRERHAQLSCNVAKILEDFGLGAKRQQCVARAERLVDIAARRRHSRREMMARPHTSL